MDVVGDQHAGEPRRGEPAAGRGRRGRTARSPCPRALHRARRPPGLCVCRGRARLRRSLRDDAAAAGRLWGAIAAEEDDCTGRPVVAASLCVRGGRRACPRHGVRQCGGDGDGFFPSRMRPRVGSETLRPSRRAGGSRRRTASCPRTGPARGPRARPGSSPRARAGRRRRTGRAASGGTEHRRARCRRTSGA